MEKDDSVYEPINIKALATRLNPTLGSLIPRFLYRRFEKILHVDEVNAFFSEHHNDTPEVFLQAVTDYLNIKLVLVGAERIEALKGRKVMFVSNHPYGGPEAMILFNTLIRSFPDLKLLTQSYLGFVKPLRKSCVFNQKEIMTLLEAVHRKISLLFYPSGFCSRRLKNKEVFDYAWKKTFVKIAKRNDMPILTFYTEGQLSKKMLRWAEVRKFFHIKFSFETLYLVDEMFRRRNSELRIIVGEPIEPEVLRTVSDDYELAAKIRQYCHDLKDNADLVFDPKLEATLVEQ